MSRYRYPLRELIPDALIPAELFRLDDPGVLDRVAVVDYRVRSTRGGATFRAALGIAPGADEDPELVLGLPQFPDLGVVFRTLGWLDVSIQEASLTLQLSVGAFRLRLPPALLKPVREKAGGGWEPDPDRQHVEVRFAYETEDGATSLYPFVVTVDSRGRLDLEAALLDADGAPRRLLASLDGHAMIGDTGVVIDVERLSFSLDPEDPWLAFDEAEIILPSALTGSLVFPRIALTDARLSRRGVSGSATATWPLELGDDGFVYQLDDGPQAAQLFGLNGGLRQIGVSVEENRLIAFEISGGLIVPYFDEPVEVRLDVQSSGDFAVTLLGVDAEGLTLRKEELLALSLKSLTVAKEGDVGLVRVSGGLEPLLRASEGMQWPRLDVADLEIDTEGRFSIREAWLDLKELATLDLFGFHFELSRIGLGTEEDRLWVDLSGSLRLIEQIPVGLGVEGFRISWPRDLDEILEIGSPPTLEDALEILGAIEVRFDGIYLFFGVPDAVEFEGLIRFIKTAEVVGFAGDVALRVPASGFAAEAGLMVGMNFEPPPYPFLYVYFGVELPAGIPLGQSGLALKGALGLFGLNVSPAKAPEENWYYDWYKRPPIVGAHPTNKWRPERSALSFGAGLTITTADGYVKGTRGLLVFSIPGPILIIEGRALVLSGLGPGEPPLRALAVLDGREQIAQFNVEAQAELVEDMLEASGGLEAFFDFKDLRNWHVYLGQDTPEDRQIQANVFKLPDADRFLFKANGYYMVDMTGGGALRSRMGVFVGLTQQMKHGPLTLDLDAWIEGAGQVTLGPEQFSSELELGASVKISTFGFGCQVGASATVMGEGPDPFRVGAGVEVSADLPDPLEDLSTEFEFEWQSESPPPAEFLLVGAVADSDFVPRGGGLHLHGTILHPQDGDVTARLADDEGRRDEAEAQEAAEGSPVVPLDARPTLLFAHDMNDASDGRFARDVHDAAYAIGRFRLEPTLAEVTLYEHPQAEPWTGTFESDWHLVASSNPDAVSGDAQRLWGVWLADAGTEDPGAAGARRLRLWTSNPFVYARGYLGGGYQRIFGFGGPRVSHAEEFLGAYPAYLECRGAEPVEACLDFADAPEPPKADKPEADRQPDAGPASDAAFTHGGVTFIGVTELEPHPDGSAGPCLATQGKLRLRLPEPVVRVRLMFCRDPHLSGPGARSRVAARRDRVSDREAEVCAIEVPCEVEVDGPSWVVTAGDGLDCLDLTRPAPLEAICFLTRAETARAQRARRQCEQNEEAVACFDKLPPVLTPGTYYRLIVKSTVDIELTPSDSPLAATLDALYGAALSALTGSDGAGTIGFLQEAFFRTTGPPETLRPYVKWSSPEAQANRVFRDDDLLVRFLRPTVRAMFDASPHTLTAIVRDAQGRRAAGYDTAWSRAATPTLLPDEAVWLAHVPDAPAPAPDDVLEIRRAVVFADNLDDPHLRSWEVIDGGATGSPWRVVEGELRCVLPLFRGGVARRDLAKPGPMIVATTPDLRPTGSTRQLALAVDLRSDSGEAIGVVVAYADRTRYYRFSMDDTQRYRRLVKVASGAVTALFETANGFERDEPHEVEVTFGPAPEGQRLRIRIDGRLWCDVTDRSQPIRSERVGLYCWRNAHARFLQVRVREADTNSTLAPSARHELVIGDAARDTVVLHRVRFVTSAYRRFRDLVLTFPGQALDLAGFSPAPSAGEAAASVTAAMTAYADKARQWERDTVRHRDQELGRDGLEGSRIALRDQRAALDLAYQVLADALGLPLFDPPPATLAVAAIRGTSGAVLGFWLRSPETLDLRYAGTGVHTGRTAIALRRWVPTTRAWVHVPATVASNSDSLQVLLLPAPDGASTWIAGSYRATFTYHRNHGDEAIETERPFARPIQQYLGSQAPEHASIEWRVF